MTMNVHPAFTLARTVDIATLDITMEEYRHNVTGAVHYHLSAQNTENVFLVGLRTVPMDHKGVAHILEHTALCGSKRFNVRDPFFMMIRRSLNTFMNAFTSNDWTAYPFASQNKKDFNNLLDVYLDAVFFANLDELDFKQEGHRIEFETPDDPSSDLVYKGVVFNEMKGAMSSVNSVLWQTLCKHLFPCTTYHFNSGGDPEYITDLSYDELKAFYTDHYHPSNAIFMTFGDMPAGEHHEQFEEKVLKHFSKSDAFIHVPDEKRLLAPTRVQEAYAFDSPDEAETATHLNLGWLLGQSTSLEDVLQANLLSYVLLENSASPLQQYLESSPLGTAPSALCGLEDSYKELVFVCGLSGAKASDNQQFVEDVQAVLTKVASEGVPYDRLKAIVGQLELSQREIGGDSYPYGLQLILAALPCVTHRGDPAQFLDMTAELEKLHESIKDPDFIKGLVKRLLIDNTHRVSLTATADKSLSGKKSSAEAAQLKAIKDKLSEAETKAIIEGAKALQDRQSQVDDPGCLPKVTLADVPDEITVIEGKKLSNATYFQQGTNGISYQQVVIPLPNLTDEEAGLLRLYSSCLTELGFNDANYLDVQNRQSDIVGSIHAYSTIKAAIDNPDEVNGFIVLSAKALDANKKAMAELLNDTLQKVVFTEKQRIKELVSQIRQRKEQSVTSNGHMLAAMLAASSVSGLAGLNNRLSGVPGIAATKALDNALNEEEALDKLCETLESLHRKVLLQPSKGLLISDKNPPDKLPDEDEALLRTATASSKLTLNNPTVTQHEAWLVNSQVNFCAKAHKTVPQNHPDAAALTVLGGFLRNGYLHNAIREKGGAYGAGASQDSNLGCFKFYSYRDPRLSETLADFDKAIDWLKNNAHQDAQLEEAILGVISSLDKPSSPAGEAKHAFYYELFGQTPDVRRAFRKAVLSVTLDDLVNLADKYFKSDQATIGVISHEGAKDELNQLGLTIHTL